MNYQKQSNNNDEQDQLDYQPGFGLKKMLYKYEHENLQLKTQIKALSGRLQDIITKKKQEKIAQKLPPASKNAKDSYAAYHQQNLKKQMNFLVNKINQVKIQIQSHKQIVSQQQDERITLLQNNLKNANQQIIFLNQRLKQCQQRRQNRQKQDTVKSAKGKEEHKQNYEQKMKQLQIVTDSLKKNIRQLQRDRDFNNRNSFKAHKQMVNLNLKNRQLYQMRTISPTKHVQQDDQPKKKKAIWNMDYSQQNYEMVRNSIQQLRKQKQQLLDPIRQENQVLRGKLFELKEELQILNQHSELPPQINLSSRIRRKIITPVRNQKGNGSVIEAPVKNKSFVAYQPTNDKNYAPKKARKVQWMASGPSSGGISWNDGDIKSPIIGVNMWMDGYLLGIQFLHSMGESPQHLQLPLKKVNPIQYRLNNDDYLQNAILHINDNKIVGFQFVSKNGRNDSFGMVKTKAKAFNFGIKKPQKPIFSYGTFRIGGQNVSFITKIGFQIV